MDSLILVSLLCGTCSVVFAQTATATLPCKRAFHDPAFGKRGKALLLLWLGYDLRAPAALLPHPLGKGCAIVAAVRPDNLQPVTAVLLLLWLLQKPPGNL